MNKLNENETAQEGSVQEQYTGECKNCKKYNEITLPSRVHTAPEYCMKCGRKMFYSGSSVASLNVARAPQVGQ